MRFLLRLVIVLACLAGLAWTVRSLGPERILAAAQSADRGWLAASVLAMVARFAVWTVKWRTMLLREGSFGWLDSARTLMAAAFVNLTTPSAKLAGGFVRAAMVARRTGWGFARCYGWAFADQFTNTLGNVTLSGIVCLGAISAWPDPFQRRVLAGLGIAALVGVTVMVSLRGFAWRQVRRPGVARSLARFTPARFRVDSKDGERAAWIEPVLAPLLHVGATSKVVPRDLGLAALSCSFLCVSNACALEAVGLHVAILPAAAATILATFLGTMATTPGGIGATELALIGLYAHLRVPPEAAAAGALLHRAAYYLVSLAGGGLALAAEGRFKKSVNA